MEGVSAGVFSGFKLGRWKQRGYKRINDVPGEARKSQRRRFWKISPRIKLRLNLRRFSPKKFLVRLRDAYVNMMLRIANSPAVGGFAGDGFGPRQFKEYDEKMLVQIYKSLLIAQSQLVPRDVDTGRNCLPAAALPVAPKI